MLYIEKQACPVDIQMDIDGLINDEWWEHISEEPSKDEANLIRKNYFDKLNKRRVREALIGEQHGLCAYCMTRIENNKFTTIEHWYPLSKSKKK
jgi:hypothetical protein